MDVQGRGAGEMSDTAPDYVEPLEGWRVWRFVRGADGVRLLSLVQDTLWPPREELVAECRTRRFPLRLRRRVPHRAPCERCRCGIYATTLDQLGPLLDEPSWHAHSCLFGQVLLWGSVVECERGWRASHAYPSRIYVARQTGGDAGNAACAALAHDLDDYAVPIETLPVPPREALEYLAPWNRQLGSLR